MLASREGGTYFVHVDCAIIIYALAFLRQHEFAEDKSLILVTIAETSLTANLASYDCWLQGLATRKPPQLYSRSSREEGGGWKPCGIRMGSVPGS